MERGPCERCKTVTVLEKHHILPQNKFDGEGRVIKLCPTCHREFHDLLGTKNVKKDDPDYHQYTFWKWFITRSMIVIAFIYLVRMVKF